MNSNSSQSISIEHREAGNDADDELISDDLNKQPTRRRLRRINREDSFSLSDSELNERRKRIRRNNFTFDHIMSTSEDIKISVDERRKEFHQAIKDISERKPRLNNLHSKTSIDQYIHLNEDDSIHNESGFTENKYLDETWKKRLATLTSVDNTYRGFGLSKTMRNDFVSQLDAFRNLGPTRETLDEAPSSMKITHWQDENVFIPYSDDNGEMHDDSEAQLDNELNEQSDNTHECRIPPKIQRTDDLSQADDGTVMEAEPIDYASNPIESVDARPDWDTVHTADNGNGIVRASTYFDMFSSFDHSYLHDDVEPSDVAMLGDVVSLTSSGEETIVRIAGAGLRYGTVGINNSFQVCRYFLKVY